MDNQRGTTRENAFTQWLLYEMDIRRWKPRDLAMAAGISRNQVILVLEHARFPGDRFLRGIAAAFNMPQKTVFSLAGLLTDGELDAIEEDEAARKVRLLLAALDAAGRERAVHLLEQYVKDHAAPAHRAPVAPGEESAADGAAA